MRLVSVNTRFRLGVSLFVDPSLGVGSSFYEGDISGRICRLRLASAGAWLAVRDRG